MNLEKSPRFPCDKQGTMVQALRIKVLSGEHKGWLVTKTYDLGPQTKKYLLLVFIK